MATSADFEDFLSCDICQCQFEGRDPRYLSCHHAFCLQCLKDVYLTASRQDMNEKNYLVCPSCKDVTSLQNQTLDQLKPYFHAHQVQEILQRAEAKPNFLKCMLCRRADSTVFCLPCVKTFCDTCFQTHKRMEQCGDHKTRVCKQENLELFICEAHPQSLINTFCIECDTGICSMCLFGDHEGHSCRDFSLKSTREGIALRSKIDRDVANAKIESGSLSELLDAVENQIETMDCDLLQHQASLHMTINDQINEFRARLQDIKEEAKNEITYLSNQNSDSQAILEQKLLKLNRLMEPIPGQPAICLENMNVLINKLQAQLPRSEHHTVELGNLRFAPGCLDVLVGRLKGSLIKDMTPEELMDNLDTEIWWPEDDLYS